MMRLLPLTWAIATADAADADTPPLPMSFRRCHITPCLRHDDTPPRCRYADTSDAAGCRYDTPMILHAADASLY